MMLLPGTYRLVVLTVDGTPGEFTLAAAAREPQACASTALALGSSIDGQLASSDCVLTETAPFINAPQLRADLYTIEVAEEREVTVRAASNSFAPVVLVMDAGYMPIDVRSSEVRWTAKPGIYYVAITDGRGTGGGYTVTAQ
jgi:hypothetical protein